ncbi:LacI family DNA-binding transcriptional regulator [Streptosporangium sp. 'caverna']|uniref:LacI family DNA-binding transcriptional regulator n=1 Tax=Streptosporangium sp. 'caverna' TaxID=2202249 RepID=UPI000D7E964D|nr:LacI family DNA-binding transcriptional regulator [Streptosporangium sp. 'caverna']AWS44341.1 LacI family transcriptional regulator [Streptosporangium sp. 'caverna']
MTPPPPPATEPGVHAGSAVRRPTLKDVANEAGVHPATASRALNPETRHLVNDETAQRVHRVADSLGYQPNPIARSLKTARSSSIGLVIPDLTNPLFPPIVRGVEDVLGGVGYNAWIVNTDNDPARETAAVESLQNRSVEGFVFATARLHHPLLERLAAIGTPTVLVNRRLAMSDIPSVTGDDAGGVAMAMRHLVELGHRKIVHLAGPQDLSTGVNRLRAFRQALEDHGLENSPSRLKLCSAWAEAAGAKAVTELLDDGVEFTAVLAGNDLLALGCYDALAERGLSCPDDVSVVGFNDMPFVDKLSPPLTTVRIPHYEVGAEAAHLLLERLRAPSRSARSILLPLTLVNRKSTAPPRRL